MDTSPRNDTAKALQSIADDVEHIKAQLEILALHRKAVDTRLDALTALVALSLATSEDQKVVNLLSVAESHAAIPSKDQLSKFIFNALEQAKLLQSQLAAQT